MSGRKTINDIRGGVRAGIIPPVFRPQDINRALGIEWAGTFLPKHRVGNPGGNSELFSQVGKGVYKLKQP